MVYAIIVPTIEFLFLGGGLTGLLHQNTYKKHKCLHALQ